MKTSRNPRRRNPAPLPKAWHGSARAIKSFKAPAFFADDRKAARWFAVERAGAEPGVLMEVELDIRNPATSADLIRAAKAAGVAVVESPYFEAPEVSKYAPYDGSNPLDLVYIPKVRAELLKRGFDGVRAWDLLEADEIEVWITLKNGQAQVLATHRMNPRARRVSTAVLGERVRVFRNLHTQTWSMESATTGRIIAHPDTVLLEDVRLISRDAGREKTRRTGAKNVHAVASGTLVAIDGPAPADLARWTPLYYNPFKVDTFVEFVDGKVGKPVRGSRMWFAAADHRSQYALAPQEADPGRYKKPKAPRRENGFLASLALVGIGMAAGIYVEEQKGVAARVRSSLKGKDKVAREQFDRLKRGVLEAKPRARETQPRPTLAIRTSAPITVRSSVMAAVTDPAWVREESPDGKGYVHARTMKGTPYEVFERVYGKGNKVVVLDVGEEHERINAPNGQDGWPSVAAAKRAAEALAGMRLASV
jgi:hypothetical protein